MTTKEFKPLFARLKREVDDRLIALGFDRSNAGRAHCSQCEAMVINGHATHEAGCPNTRHECKGCNAAVPRGVRYCPDCN